MLLLRYLILALVVVGTFGGGSAGAGPCTEAIDRLEAAAQTLGSDFGHQSSAGVRPGRQPTSASVAKARRDAMAEWEHHQQILRRARAADASGDRAGCLKALDEASHDSWMTKRSPDRLRHRSQ